MAKRLKLVLLEFAHLLLDVFAKLDLIIGWRKLVMGALARHGCGLSKRNRSLESFDTI